MKIYKEEDPYISEINEKIITNYEKEATHGCSRKLWCE